MKNLKVRNKIFVMIGISFFIAVTIAILSFVQTDKMTSTIETVYEEKLLPNDWLSNAIAINLRIDNIMMELIATDDTQTKVALQNEMNEGIEQVLAEFALYEQLPLTDSERANLTAFYASVDQLTPDQEEVIRLAVAGKRTEAYNMYVDVLKAQRLDLVEQLQAMRAEMIVQTQVLVDESVASGKSSKISNLAINIVAIVVLVFLGLMISRMVTEPLEQLRTQLQRLQQGDFTARGTYTSNDELGQLTASFNETFDTLTGALVRIKEMSEAADDTSSRLSGHVEQVTTANDHVVATIRAITDGTEGIKEKLMDNAIIMERVANGFNDVHHNIHNVEHLAASALVEAKEGANIVNNNVNQMKSIKHSIQRSHEVIQTLSSQVSDVDAILQVIDGISNQTNLLALNAAIEAARAGEQGKGFAVVADEVRKLAEQSMEATKSVASILSNIKTDTAQSVDIMNVVLDEAEHGLVVTNETAKKFDDILKNTSDVEPVLHVAKDAIEKIVRDFALFKDGADAILDYSLSNVQNSNIVTEASNEQTVIMTQVEQSSHVVDHIAVQLNEVTKKFSI